MHLSNVLDLSRAQFAMTAIFHIMWPILTISLSAFLVLVEVLWLRTGKVGYYRHARFWSKLLVLNFAVGVVSGIPMEFQFGTNWAGFSRYSGQFFGNILGFEGAMAFMLEAGFIGVMLLGWGRVPRAVHLFATSMVALGSSISAFWIMVANSWMQTPAGVTVENGKIIVTDYAAAIFNPDMVWGVTHMWVAAIETGMFVIAGISAWNLFKRRNPEFFARSFKIALLVLVFVAPLQIWLGDSSGGSVFASQPAKGAAIEGHWITNKPGTAASWSLLAWPDKQAQRNDWSIEVPGMLSVLATHTLDGTVKGLTDFPRRPAAHAALALLRIPRNGRHRLRFHGARVLDRLRPAQDMRQSRTITRATQTSARMGAVHSAALCGCRSRLDCARGGTSAVGCLRVAAYERRCVDGGRVVGDAEHGDVLCFLRGAARHILRARAQLAARRPRPHVESTRAARS